MTLASEFKLSRLISRKNLKNEEGHKPTSGELDFFKHDLLTSLHSIRLGMSQVKNKEHNSELISAMEDELNFLMSVTEKNFLNKKIYSAQELANDIKKFFLFAYPEDQWRSFFEFKVENLGDKNYCI